MIAETNVSIDVYDIIYGLHDNDQIDIAVRILDSLNEAEERKLFIND